MMTSTKSTNSSAVRDTTSQPANLNIFSSRTRRYSASYSGLTGPRLIHRVSQLRQEECADMNTREVTHEREVHTALQISQSYEDLSLDTENWSVKSDSELTNALHVNLSTTGGLACSSPSPTNNRIRLPFCLSPSPTRRTFATRRSMSPIAMRPSSLGTVKRKFELDDNCTNSCSPQPFKKVCNERNSPICQSPSLTCPSPDSTEGRTTPKFYISKFNTNLSTSSSSLSSSPKAAPSPSMEIQIDLPSIITSSESTITTPLTKATDGCFNDVDIELINSSDDAKNIKSDDYAKSEVDDAMIDSNSIVKLGLSGDILLE